jgi:hypothetical protein
VLTNPDPNRNIEELNNDEIYAAICYLEPDPKNKSTPGDDTATTDENDNKGILICVCLYVAMLGCLAIFWLYLK